MSIKARNAVMNKSIRLFLFATGLMTALGTIYAQDKQIYTWTDENGVVHYVDTPPDRADAVSMDVPEAYHPGSADAYPPADADSIDADNPGNEDVSAADSPANEEVSYADEKREQMAREREQRRKEQADRKRNCALASQRLADLEPARRVFSTNAQGEPERMDDEERLRLIAEAKALVAENCE
jgi:hypothetical protein